jgi:DNA-binding NarL/FixJ family response regulator
MRILLAHPDRRTRRALRRALASSFREILCAEAGSVAQALNLLGRSRWDVVMVGARLSDAGGRVDLPRFREAAPNTPLVVVSRRATHREEHEVTRDGAAAYLAVTGPAAALVEAVRRLTLPLSDTPVPLPPLPPDDLPLLGVDGTQG